ncbi:Xaa-Pro aminopeptidase 1 [Cyphomyrmex costatus]|uniref:Xaa-Pro aminopeptidase 1 n=1 Tax=Cyphomyrmex costatus TaxID=456900 RepID=A0A195C2Z5_9HYME|nr:Xaa-Pro aminopeptidase 1 [Cyphomyrmex costatus]
MKHACAAGLTKANTSTLLNPEHYYNGAERLYCPANAYVGNQPVDRQDSFLRLRQLRSEMVRVAAIKGPALDGYIVTSDDEHQTVSFISHGHDGPVESEAVDPHDMRREFLTGFHGSAGEAIVTIDKAVLWTDGRYHIQANHQLDCNWILMKRGEHDVPTITEWLIQEFQNRSEVRIGANPKLIPAFTWETWEHELVNSSVRLVAVHNDLVDLIWQVGRPEYNPHAAYPLTDEYSGKPWQEKVQNIRLEMEYSSVDALIVTALDEIAWLFNVRGYDLPHTPVLRAYTIVTHESLHLYAPRQKILRSVDIHLKIDSCSHANCVKWHNYTDIWYDLRTMSQAWNTVWLPSPYGYSPGASKEIYNSIPPEKRFVKASPIIDLKAEKNKVEVAGMRRSHLRDAMAMCDFLAYMEEQYKLDSEGWDEMQVVRVINEIRYEQDGNRGIAFPTIVGYGPHAAMPHYEPNNLTNIKIGTTSTLVIDSGGQYLDGTTDVTRTLHLGVPTDEQKKAYTRVLIGSIELSSLIFPNDLPAEQLDIIARRSLWSSGYNYMHGTGHGIGHFSSVHEFSCKSYNGQRFLKFRDVTLVPYEPKLIKINMLTSPHRRWLNNYNRRIRKEVGAELKKNLKMKAFYWMMAKTTTIPETDSYFFSDNSQAMPSTNRQFHTLVIIVAIYHIIKSKRYSNTTSCICYYLLIEARMMHQFLLQISQEYTTKLGNTSMLSNTIF